MTPERRWRMSRYTAAWLALFAVAALLRFSHLGDRAMSHDESQHAFYSWVLAEGGGYVHQPLLHGPLLFHLTGLLFFIAGSTETLARVYPAMAGLLLVLAPLALKPWLGRRGALASAALIALSPSLTFYSRYLRSDVPATLFALIWLGAAFAWVESRQRRWLWILTAGMAASFGSKETAFLTGLIVGLWALYTAWRGRSKEHRSAAASLAVLLLTLVAPFLAGLVAPLRNPDENVLWSPGDLVVALALGLVATLVARWWAGRGATDGGLDFALWRLLAGLFWGVQLVLFSSFLTAPAGVGTGVVGSLAYWVRQHQVERGGQPFWYYGMLGGLYEFLPILLALAAVMRWLRSSSRERQPFVGFLVWWATASVALYSTAGERMPWLLVHIVLPTTLLGGWWLGQYAADVQSKRQTLGRGLAVAAAGPAGLLLAWRCLTLQPFVDTTPAGVSETLTWAVQLLLLGYLLLFLIRDRQRSGSTTRRWILLGVLGVLALLTLRATVHLSFRHHDLAVEPLVYAHGTSELRAALRELDHWGPGLPPPLFLDPEARWPLIWYLRSRPNRFTLTPSLTPKLEQAPIVIVGQQRRARVRELLQTTHRERSVRFLLWPLEDYRDLDVSSALDWLKEPDKRTRLWRILLYRRYLVSPSSWPMKSELSIFVINDLEAAPEPP